MTTVNVLPRNQSLAGLIRTSSARVEWTPDKTAMIGGGRIIMAVPMKVDFTSTDTPVANLEPCDGTEGWCWKVEVKYEGEVLLRRYVLVPDTASVVDFDDLQDVNPHTLVPVGRMVGQWGELLSSLEAARDAAPNGITQPTSTTLQFTTPDGVLPGTITLPSGPQGSPGVNAVPAAQAVAAYMLDGGTPVPGALDAATAALVEDAASETSAYLTTTFIRSVMPEAFGAVGDGVVDDTAAVQAAIDSLPAGGGWVLLAQRYKITTVTITTPNIRVTGPGAIVDGTIAIGQDGTAPPYARLDARIDTIAFYRASNSTTVNAITAARCMGIKIDDVDFTGYNAAFYVRPQSFTGANTHHVARVRMSRIKTTNCQFVLRTTKYTSGGGLLACADIKISDSQELAVLDSHVFCEGIDGLRLTDVTLFMPGFNASSATKRWNVRVDGGTHVELTAVHCFEAGLEGIYLSKIQSFGFSDVEVWAPGQRVRSAGVRVNGGDTAGAQFCFGDLDGTRIIFPSLHGVWIEGQSGHIKVPHVTVRSPGASSYYYGPTDATPAEYVLSESTTRYVNVGAECEFTTGSGSPRVVVRGADSHGRAGSAHSVFFPASMTAGNVNFSTNAFSSAYPFGVRTISSASVQDNITYYADLTPGTYALDLWHDKGADRGIYSVRINGVEVGTVNGYAASPAPSKDTLTGITVPVGGRVSIVLFMATKDAASSAYRGAIHGLAMTRTGGF